MCWHRHAGNEGKGDVSRNNYNDVDTAIGRTLVIGLFLAAFVLLVLCLAAAGMGPLQ